jgi:nitrogen regulatory protein P-II 1
MKKIEALIATSSFQSVRDALAKLGIEEMTAVEAKHFAPETGHTEMFRGTEYTVDFTPKVKLEILAEDHQADSVAETILEAAKTRGARPRLLVSDVEEMEFDLAS